MRRTPFHVWLLVVCLLAGRFALAAHDAQHALGSPQAHACVACLHGGGADDAGIAASFVVVVAAPELRPRIALRIAPALRLLRPYQGRAPPHLPA